MVKVEQQLDAAQEMCLFIFFSSIWAGQIPKSLNLIG